MRINNEAKMRIKNQIIWILFMALFLASFLLIFPSTSANIVGGNYKNITVWTHVNITNAKPEIIALIVYQETTPSVKNITLSGGSGRIVTCNATIRDWNGYNDIVAVNATLYYAPTANHTDPDNNNTHYSNLSCSNTGNGANYTVNWVCGFNVYYYANNGTWNCNVTAKDNQSKTNWRQNSTYIYSLYALNVTDGIDYGNAAVEEYTQNTTANITNFGNMAINITIEGYGAVRNDGLAMNCSLGGNISISNEKYALIDVDYATKTALTGSSQLIPGLTMPKQTDSTQIINTTYWELYVSSNNVPGGNCSGNVLFTAIAP